MDSLIWNDANWSIYTKNVLEIRGNMFTIKHPTKMIDGKPNPLNGTFIHYLKPLNFVQNLKIEGDKVSFDLRLTTPACPIRDQFKDQCIAIVKSLGASEVNVTFTAQGRVEGSNAATQAPKVSYIGEVSHVVAVASGKGGVGKSTVTANLAMALSLSGARVGILDADIYGPSMGLMFGIDRAPEVFDDNTIAPVEAKGGISIVSMCMFADSDKATIWRGPMVSQMIQHFIHHVRWGKLDYLLVDFPPGTGDIQLTLTQNCPMAGAVVVTTPQEVALADCRKGLRGELLGTEHLSHAVGEDFGTCSRHGTEPCFLEDVQ